MSAKGHKGAKSRAGTSHNRVFEGGQTPLHRRVPKRGFNNPDPKIRTPLGLDKLVQWIKTGRLDSSKTIVLKDLYDSNIVGKFDLGIKLLGEVCTLSVCCNFFLTGCEWGRERDCGR